MLSFPLSPPPQLVLKQPIWITPEEEQCKPFKMLKYEDFFTKSSKLHFRTALLLEKKHAPNWFLNSWNNM